MFHLQRQNRKNEKIQNGNRKSQKLKKPQNIKSQIQCFSRGKTNVFPGEKKWKYGKIMKMKIGKMKKWKKKKNDEKSNLRSNVF